MSSNEHVTRDQHFVSQTLMQSWVDPVHKRLRAYQLQYGTDRLQTTRQVNYEPFFLQHDPNAAEAIWGALESGWPQAMRQIQSRQLLDDRTTKAVLNMMTLHFIRSPGMKQRSGSIIDRVWQDTRASIVHSQRDALQASFRRRHGLEPAGPESTARAFDELMEAAAERRATGALLQDRMISLLERASEFFHRYDVQIVEAIGDEEFLLGDHPGVLATLGVDAPRRFVGPLASAHTYVLPLSPRFMAALGPDALRLTIDDEGVRAWNRLQVEAADKRVLFRDGYDGKSFIASARPAERMPRQV